MSDACACVCDLGHHADWPDVIKVTVRRAKKEYRCCECGEAIQPGEKYEYVWGVWEGKQSIYRTCDTCRRIRNDFCCSWIYGGLRDALRECLGFDYVTGELSERA